MVGVALGVCLFEREDESTRGLEGTLIESFRAESGVE